MLKTVITYKGRKPDVTELLELFPILDISFNRTRSKLKTVTDPTYKIDTLDWTWFRSLFDGDVDIRALVLENGDLTNVGIKDHWGFYSLDTDGTHDFYMTDIEGLDSRAKANGFKTNFTWMFVHEYLHGSVWGISKNRDIAASLVHKWEAEGTLKQHLAEALNVYKSLNATITQKTAEVVKLKSMKTLKIYRPMISSKITQHWGENGACIDNHKRVTNAIKEGVCKPGTVPFYQSIGMLYHNGIDISALIGEDVYHAGTYDGWMKTEHDNAGGIGVDVVSNEPLFFAGPIPEALKATATPIVGGYMHHIFIRQWHLKAAVGFDGKKVKCGEVIGLAGMSGAASGPHNHISFKFCTKDGRSVDNDNQLNGAQDPTPYYDNSVTAKDHAKYLLGGAPQPTPQEAKDMLAQLSMLQMALVTLQKIKHNI
jgi:murein DD-endopeptidase MepM/ murein hydrolase activator NlpD